MLRRLSIAEFWGLLLDHVQGLTEIPVYTSPYERKSPFYYLELLGSDPVDTKTQYIDRFKFAIHAISRPTRPFSFAPVLEMVQEIEEVMTEPMQLARPFWLVDYSFDGVRSVQKDETDEGHAVLDYHFDVSYGFKIK